MSNHSTRWSAPAKLNLFLYINGRRPDGYHELQTLFQFVDICDELEITVNQSDNIVITPEIPGVPLTDNIIYKAAMALKEYTSAPCGAEIQLTKRLPMGGGLGGGSSDAATTLVALNKLWQVGLTVDQLTEIGVRLGADVPVFIRGQAAFAEGIGEQLTPVQPRTPWYVIIAPDCHANTANIFADPALPRDTPKLSLAELFTAPWKNDFETTVKKRHPEVAKALDWLLKYAPSRLTGSGCCLFAEFDHRADAQKVLTQAPEDMRIFLTKGLNSSPLLADLRRNKQLKNLNAD